MPGTTSVVMNVNPKKASVAVGVEEHLLGGRDHIRESRGRAHVPGLGQLVLPDQHRAGRAALRARARRRRASTGSETVIDLYSGTGAISLLLARRCRWVYGIEVAPGRGGRRGAQRGAPTASPTARSSRGEVRFVLPAADRARA